MPLAVNFMCTTLELVVLLLIYINMLLQNQGQASPLQFVHISVTTHLYRPFPEQSGYISANSSISRKMYWTCFFINSLFLHQ